MNPVPWMTLAARVALVASLAIISWLATTEISSPAIQSFNDKFLHAVGFFGLAALSDFAFPGSDFSLKKFLPLLAYGFLIELVQHFLPYREFSLADVLADGAGIALYPLSVPLIRRIPLLRTRWD